MCGNFFKPSSSSFLGGPIGKTLAGIGGSLLLGPEIGALTGLSGATSAGLAGGLVGGGLGATSGGGLSGALKGAALGGAGGYLAGGGLSDISNGLGLTTNGVSDLLPGTGNLSDFLGGTSSLNGTGSGLATDYSSGLAGTAPDTSPLASAARDAISGSTTSAAPSSSFLSGYLPSSGSQIAGGGTSGGFYANAPDVATNLSSSLSGPIGSSAGDFASGLTTPSSPNFLNDPTGYLTNAATNGAKSVFSPANLLGGAAKTGLSYFLQKNNNGGYGAIQNAGNSSAANYQPFLKSGQGATTALSDLYGLNGPSAATAATQNWQNTPGYQFALNQGLQGIDAGAAARGMLSSGNTLQAEQNYGTGLANQYYNQYLQGLQGQQNTGLNAAGGAGQGTMDAATAYALMKANQANSSNRLLGSLSNFL